MNAGPQYQRSELRVEPDARPDLAMDERRVSTARTSRFSAAAIVAGIAGVLPLCALWGTRVSTLFMGVLVVIAGIVVVAAPDAFAASMATESSYGVFLMVLGGIVALTSLVIPDRSSRVVTYR
jgi:hypothetical protein